MCVCMYIWLSVSFGYANYVMCQVTGKFILIANVMPVSSIDFKIYNSYNYSNNKICILSAIYFFQPAEPFHVKTSNGVSVGTVFLQNFWFEISIKIGEGMRFY